jgi:hypothetical protein
MDEHGGPHVSSREIDWAVVDGIDDGCGSGTAGGIDILG